MTHISIEPDEVLRHAGHYMRESAGGMRGMADYNIPFHAAHAGYAFANIGASISANMRTVQTLGRRVMETGRAQAGSIMTLVHRIQAQDDTLAWNLESTPASINVIRRGHGGRRR